MKVTKSDHTCHHMPQEVKVTKSDHTCHHLQWACYNNKKWKWSVWSRLAYHVTASYDIHLPRLLWECNVLDMYAIVKGSDRTDKLEGNASIANCGLHPGKFKVLINLKHYLGAQSQGHHTIDQREERAVERGSTWKCSSQSDENWNCFTIVTH